MSRPQKIIPPIKGGFADIINNVADGRGVAKPGNTRSMANEKPARPQPRPPTKKP
jgi:hypothetical protein